MDEPLWRRVRRYRRGGDDDRGSDAGPSRSAGVTVPDEPSGLSDLGDLGDSGDKRAEYAEWANRMRAKRDEKRATLRQLAADVEDGSRPGYWSADFVWEESRRLQAEGTAVAGRLDHLAVLGLGLDATDDEIVATYRRRAKEHHPDRFPDADDATLSFHIEQMQRLTAAYRALQQPGGPR